MNRGIHAALGLVLVLTMLGAAPQRSGVQYLAQRGDHVLLDENISNEFTDLPVQDGVTYVDSAGYEMYNAKTNPEVVWATLSAPYPLATYAVTADLISVQGRDTAPYGVLLRAGSTEYVFAI